MNGNGSTTTVVNDNNNNTSTNNISDHDDALKSLIYQPDATPVPTLQVLDQLRIPDEKVYVDVSDVTTTWSVIRNMQIRGAPLIAIVACLGLAVDLHHPKTVAELDALEQQSSSSSSSSSSSTVVDALQTYLRGKLDYLATSRPTAVNLFHALTEIQHAVQHAFVVDNVTDDRSPRQIMVDTVMKHAQFMLERDVEDCYNIGRHGADCILRQPTATTKSGQEEKVTIMTICNTGSLATAGYGTALGVVRALIERDRLHAVIALETRPYNQGSRLTAYEMVHDRMPGAVLICDNMVAAYMSTHHVHAVVVGADRVCANGDTANKIGTYNTALVAFQHNVPFYVAAPSTTLDTSLPEGSHIAIEERPAMELLVSSRAPTNIDVWNPAFDVTPAKWITGGIITECGVIRPDPYNPKGPLDVAAFLANNNKGMTTADSTTTATTSKSSLEVPTGYVEQTVQSLPLFLERHAPNSMKVLQAKSADDLNCVEMGDGNLNLVFIVTNRTVTPVQQVIVKQALPYVRCVGESWPLTLERSHFEYKALVTERHACPEFVPMVYDFFHVHGLMVMQYMAPPYMILRKGLIQGIRYPTMAVDMGQFCAKTLFRTSGFALTATEIRKQVQFWSTNTELCALTEQVIFTEPYITAPNNRWTSPQLDHDKHELEHDSTLLCAAAQYKHKFITETQALIHGDLHSGSVMCAPNVGATAVIDPEFAFYGPMGFDTGALVANFFLAYCAQPGHSNGDTTYAEWILEKINEFWSTFVSVFQQQWDDPAFHTGYWYGRELYKEWYDPDTTQEIRHQEQNVFFRALLSDTLGFAGMKMIRRIVGIAHVEDLDSITDPDVRAICERHALDVAKVFVKNAASFDTMADAIALARSKKGAS